MDFHVALDTLDDMSKEDKKARLWNGCKDSEPLVNRLLDALIPHRKAYWIVKNVVDTDGGHKYELWFSRQSRAGERKEHLFARVSVVFIEWSCDVEHQIYTFFDKKTLTYGGSDFPKIGVELHQKWQQYLRGERIKSNTLAFLCATHPRLGAEFKLATLEEETLVKIGKMCLEGL